MAVLSSFSSLRWMVSLPATTLPVVEHLVLAVGVADEAAGLAQDDDAGGEVPGAQVALPEAVEAAGGDPGEVERGGAGAADAGRDLP